MAFSLRHATLDDVSTLREVIAESARGLSRGDYTDQQVDAALGNAFGVDTELIEDRTYFVVEAGKRPEGLEAWRPEGTEVPERTIVACGGWSCRKTLFGADGRAGRESQKLDPTVDAARIRAFFVRPQWARQGIGRLLLDRCEHDARAAGFRAMELMATLPGRRLYAAAGYLEDQQVEYDLGDGVRIELVPMRKALPQGPST